jgi:hypothetical protein
LRLDVVHPNDGTEIEKQSKISHIGTHA